MFKKVFSLIKKIVFSFFFLYAYNVIASPLKCVIPMNVFTIGTMSVLGIPSFFSFVIIKLLLF